MNYFLGSNLRSQNDSYAGMNGSKNLYMQLLIDWFERLFKIDTVAYPKGGMGGPDPPTSQKVDPQDSHKNVIKLVGGGESDRSVKKWSLRSLKSKHRMVFQGFAARFCFLRNA